MNFIIFMPDEMRADAAGCYGHPLIKTPNLDRLAAEGTRFEQCYVQHPFCSPSRVSMLTGWYPHVNGHRTLTHLLRPDEPNLFRYLKQAGYDVRWYGKNDALAEKTFADSVTQALGSPATRHGGRLSDDPANPLYDSFMSHPHGDVASQWDNICVQRGIDFLRSKHDRPFVLYLPLILPHPPYSAPQPWHDMYDPKDVPALRPPGVAGKPLAYEMIRQTRRLDQLNDEHLRKIAAVYLGMISYSDYLLGQLLAALDETKLADDTCVIFTSDHGDFAGEWGLVEKWSSALDDTITRVPLVIRMPGGAEGHRVAEPVEMFDIMATMLELAAVPAEHTHFSRSLVEQLGGAAGDATRAVFCEAGFDTHEGRSFGTIRERSSHYYHKTKLQEDVPASVCRSVMIRDGRYKLIHRQADTCELYDMQADPRELNNLYGQAKMADVQRGLEKRLLDFYLHTSDVTPWDEDHRGLPPGSNV